MIPAFLTPSEADVTRFAGGEGPDLMRYLLVCGFLILLIVALGWAFRRFVAGNVRGRVSRRALSTLDVLPLGGRQTLAVVRCYDRTFLVGVGDKEVRLLSEIEQEVTETDEAPELTAMSAVGKKAGAFLDTLTARMGEPAGPKPDSVIQRRSVRSVVKSAAQKLPGGGLLG